jgi:chromosome segregation ATPase
MSKAINFIPRLAVFVAGAAAGALLGTRRSERRGDPGISPELKKSLEGLELRFTEHELASSARLTVIETRLDEHATKLTDVPSTTQIVAAMEQLLSKTMASLDDRLTTQARSIEVLKTTVSQTDSLLERVLESLDSLQSYSEPLDLTEDPLLHRSA